MGARRGLTLIEVVLAGSILAIVLALVFASLRDTGGAVGFVVSKSTLRSRAWSTTQRITRLLRQSGVHPDAKVLLDTPAPTGTFTRVGFRTNQAMILMPSDASYAGTPPALDIRGFDGSMKLDWDYHPSGTNPEMAIGFALDSGELVNGLDDDNDGLVDEGVVYIESIKGLITSRTVLCRDVLSLSFSFPSGNPRATPNTQTADRAIRVDLVLGWAPQEARASGEKLDGIDNDGDGKVDEGMLVLSTHATVVLRNGE